MSDQQRARLKALLEKEPKFVARQDRLIAELAPCHGVLMDLVETKCADMRDGERELCWKAVWLACGVIAERFLDEEKTRLGMDEESP